jgi:hypothetical protein
MHLNYICQTFSHDRAFIEVGTASLVVLQHLLLLVVSPLLLHLLPCLMVSLIRLGWEGGRERESGGEGRGGREREMGEVGERD